MTTDILRFYYKTEWSKRLMDVHIEKFFDEDGDIDSFMWLIHGQCVFAINNGVYPHELNLNRGIRQYTHKFLLFDSGL